MKKIIFLTLGILLSIASLFSMASISAHAEEMSAQTISSTITIDASTSEEDKTLEGINFTINTSDSIFVISDNTTLTIRNCNFYTNINSKVTNPLFIVETSSSLILDTVEFVEIRAKVGIENNGKIDITETTFNSLIECSVKNESSTENAFFLHSGKIPDITLNEGYISVDANTKISDTINISIPNYTHGKLVVKGIGENVFASKLINSFNFVEGEDYKDIDFTTENELVYLLDYVGDNTSIELNGELLEDGDIIISSPSLTIKNSVGGYIAGKYCTANAFLDKIISDDSPNLYKNNTSGALNNYTAYKSSKTHSIDNTYDGASTIKLTTKSEIKNSSENLPSSTSEYISGSNHAVFVDIPTNHQLESIKYEFKNNNLTYTQYLLVSDPYYTTDTPLLKVSENKYSNGVYLRPIIEYNTDEFLDDQVTITFVFQPIPQEANIVINKSDEVSVSYPENMVSNNEYTFNITLSDNVALKSITFNSETITNPTRTEHGYTFSATVQANNTLDIQTYTFPIAVIATPDTSYSFTYGDLIEMKKTLIVPETQEQIEVDFTASSLNAGTHNITDVTCENTKYNVQLASGEYTYTISPKQVSIDEITLKTHSVPYSPTLTISETDFIEYIPDYFTAKFAKQKHELFAGTQTIVINISLNDDNYTISNEEDTSIQCQLVISPIQITASLTKTSYEYTGSKINLLVSTSGVLDKDNVSILFKEDPKTDVGNYTIEIAGTDNPNYICTTESLSYSITTATIDTSTYESKVKSISTTYDGNTYTIDILEDELPELVEISSVENNSGHKDAGTYIVKIYLCTSNSNYTCTDLIERTITISPKAISVFLKNQSFTYNGSPAQLEFVFEGINPNDTIQPKLSGVIATNAGQHSITITGVNDPNYICSATTLNYYISPVNVDINEYLNQVSSNIVTYNKTPYTIDIHEELLPETIEFVRAENNNGHINAGTYTIKIYLQPINGNYACINMVESSLIINPKPITAILVENSFTYNGQPANIQVKLNDIYNNDTVTATLNSSSQVNAGSYTIDVLGVNNNNYICTTTTLSYTISPANVNLSETLFLNKTLTYDGNNHLPDISSALPSGITYITNLAECKNAGEYNIEFTFSSTNNNYIAPDTEEMTITISKKDIYVTFSTPNNLVANGEPKNISVSFTGTINNEVPTYTLSYSGDTSKAGEHICFVHLADNSNYRISNTDRYNFVVLSNIANYEDEDINLSLEGEFNPNIQIRVTKQNNDVKIINALSNKNVSSFEAYSIEYTSYSTDPITAKILASSITTDIDHLKIYKFANNKLEQIQYTTEDNYIVISMSGYNQIVFVQETQSESNNLTLIIILSATAVALLAILSIIVITKIKSKKNKATK